MSNTSPKLGYPDLDDPQFVYDALVGYGLFNERLPPCFTSKSLLKVKDVTKSKNRSYINYLSSRNVNLPRMMGIPHPAPYLYLCRCIKDNWDKINEHTGKPQIKFSRIHVQKITDLGTNNHKPLIFEMAHKSYGVTWEDEEQDLWEDEEQDLKYISGCEFVVSTDISTCFPSIYSHSLTWALKREEGQPPTRKDEDKDKKKEEEDWVKNLDEACMNLRSKRSNGLLIGPHASNILSEIVLTDIDALLQESGFENVVRNIDDYTFYAESWERANEFLREFNLVLRYYDLHANVAKTKIVSVKDYLGNRWIDYLRQFAFPYSDSDHQLEYTSVNTFIEMALRLAKQEDNFAVLKYAVKFMSERNLSDQAKRMYILKILGITVHYPYLLNLLEPQVLRVFFDSNDPEHHSILKDFVVRLLDKAIKEAVTDALAFGFYFAVKYRLDLGSSGTSLIDETIKINDCVSMTLAHEYALRKELNPEPFKERAHELYQISDMSADQYWLFVYQVLDKTEFMQLTDHGRDNLLRVLKKKDVSFIKPWDQSAQTAVAPKNTT